METGALVVNPGSVIEQACDASVGGTVLSPTITAVQVTHSTGTLTAGPLTHSAKRLSHQFVNPLKKVPVPRVSKTRTTT
jgi:hypothetical protein